MGEWARMRTIYPETVVVVGGGTMGAGIAQAFATIGSVVTVVEASREYVTSAQTG